MYENPENQNNTTEQNEKPQEQRPQYPFAPPPPQVAYYSTEGGYNPYDSGNSPKPSKGKRAGIIILSIILTMAIVVLVAVMVSIMRYTPKQGETTTDTTEITNTEDAQSHVIEFTPTPEIAPTNANQVFEKTCDTNVAVLVYAENQSQIYSQGSGVVVPDSLASGQETGKTYIVTCAHVIDISASIKVVIQTYDGTQYDATVVGMDKKTDIGVLAVNATGLKAAEFADSSTVKVGDTVYALGNPGGATFFSTFTDGMVSAIGRPVDSPVGYQVPCIQHTAPINPGNSGGALLNAYGQVIGINSSKIVSTDYEGMGFSVPTEIVKEVVEDILTHGYVTGRPSIGINFALPSQSRLYTYIIQQNNLPVGSIIIYSISDYSDLNNKDVVSGDMIIGFNGKPLEDYNDLLDYIENSKVGDTITLEICRVDQNYRISTFSVDVKIVEER